MRRRRAVQIPHREFFRAVTIEETVALACSCPRGEDHWYAEPRRPGKQATAVPVSIAPLSTAPAPRD